MKWYKSEPRKDCPILVKAFDRDTNDPRVDIIYMVVHWVEGEDAFFACGAYSDYAWQGKDFLCWTPISEIEIDIFNSDLD